MRIYLPMSYITDENRMKRRFQEYTSQGELRLLDSYTKKAFFINDLASDSESVALDSIDTL